MNNIAICFVGTARSLEHTHINIKKNLVDSVGECDILAFLAQNEHSSKFQKYFHNDKRVKEVIEEKEPDYNLDGINFLDEWPFSPTSSRQVYIKMINSRKRMGEILSSYEAQNEIVYDKVIFSRLDVKYFDDVGSYVNDIALDSLCIPDFHNTFGGVINGFNDRFAVGNRGNMGTYFNIPNSITPYNKTGGKICAENLLKYHLEVNEVLVEKLPIRFTRVRPNGDAIDMRLANQILEPRDT
tara:strand:+ start:5541 stop:6263 length:723 start_codon:yes stop_codon:yes gene_type:complete